MNGFRASYQKCGVNYIWGGLAEVESFLGEMQWTGLFLFFVLSFSMVVQRAPKGCDERNKQTLTI